jgi:hypothetical protein
MEGASQMTSFLQITQIGASIATVATAGLVFLGWKQIKLVREQARTTFEDKLTQHYRRIMEDIPTDIWLGSELQSLDKDRQERCRDAIFRYLDLCQEQAFLHDSGRVTDDTWTQWCEGIRANMRLPAFNEVWQEVQEKCPYAFLELRSLIRPEQVPCHSFTK